MTLRLRLGARLALLWTSCLLASCSSNRPGADAAALDATDALDVATGGDADAGAADGAVPLEAGAPAILTKPDGHTPSAFGCNRHYVETASGPATARTIAVTLHATHGDGPATTGTLTPIDPTLGTTIDDAGVPISAMGTAVLALAPSTHAAFKSAGDGVWCDPCVDTYAFSQWVPPGDAPLSVFNVEIDAYFGLRTRANAASSPVVIGTVRDCDGDPVMNATVQVAGFSACDPTAASPPTDCIEYASTGAFAPDRLSTATGRNGLFILFSGTTGALSIQASGLLAATDAAPSAIGTLDLVAFERSLSFGDTRPLAR